jgi:transcriptional regulator with XRE-family HTH domain
MGKTPKVLRETIARNIQNSRLKKFPGRGGAKQCAEAFGVSPQQWSPWERGSRTPDEIRLSEIADFFGVSVEWMRRDNRPPLFGGEPPRETPPPGIRQDTPHGSPPFGGARVAGAPPISWNPAPPGSPASFFWIAHRFAMALETNGLRLDKQSLEYLAQCIKSR